MFLSQLKIENGSTIVRDITFKKGLNLIIDETQTTNLQESGNNVGKTTVLRLIDFCLGGDGENVYKDTEFKDKTNTEIEDFLKNNNVVISLLLKRDLDNPDSDEIIIRKNFLKRKQKIQEINHEYYNDKDFNSKLKQLIFHSSADKPTFRQIISKNIRYEKYRLENTLKVLPFTTTFEQYEAIYFFWLGIDTDTAGRKQRLQHAKSTEEAVLKRLKKQGSLSEIKQALSVIERNIRDLNRKKASFNVNENYEDDLNQLNSTRAVINSITTQLSQLGIRREIIIESKNELEKEKANIDIQELESIYKSAEIYILPLHVKFSEMVAFHNNMLKAKIKYVTDELPAVENKIKSFETELRSEKNREMEIASRLQLSGAIEDLEEIVLKLNQKFEQKGKYEEQQRQWEDSNKKIEEIDTELKEINEGIDSYDKILDERILSFNSFFSKNSEKLYGEQFILSHDRNERAYELKISSLTGNLGTGKKKGQIAAFDIAYIQFCDENEIPCLHFLLHDQVESIHDNQLTLIAELVEGKNIQYIVPVLRDKLPQDLIPKDHTILSLSQNDKLFKV